MGRKSHQWRRAIVIASVAVAPILGASVFVSHMDRPGGDSLVPAAEAFTMRDLVLGSRGYDVDELQNRLHFLGFYKGKTDGQFGWQTYFAVRHFQQSFGMKVNGRAGFETKTRLVRATKNWHYKKPSGSAGHNSGSASSGSSGSGGSSGSSSTLAQPVPGITQSDINLMAHVVNGEARGEPYKGQVAIAAVILNRVKDPRFPHNIPQIIYHPGSFTCVSDGQINKAPDASAFKAVEAAVHGWDPSHGAVYYFNPATATNKWIWSRPELLKIGHHIFCS